MSFLSPAERARLAAWYRSELLDDVVPFWEKRAGDVEHGGYFHHFDREGRLLGTDKNVWCQGRMLWLFSALCTSVENRPAWLSLARTGRDFVVRHAYAGAGRWHYLLSRSGEVLKPNGSFFTDAFVLAGLCQYARASGRDEDRSLIEATFSALERNFHGEGFNEFHHFSLDSRYRWHSVSMIGLFVSAVAAPLLGVTRTGPLARECMENILHVFAKDSHRVLFEAVDADGAFVDDPVGRRINPGHTMESMWFCMEEALRRGDTASAQRCAQIVGWAHEKGWDARFGGMLNILDCGGGEPAAYDPSKSFGEAWDDKVWWVQSETLYALLLAAVVFRREDLLIEFRELHQWCEGHFRDRRYGEWYAYLHRDGSPKVTDKGTWIKAAFHVPRNLMQIMLLLEREAG